MQNFSPYKYAFRNLPFLHSGCSTSPLLWGMLILACFAACALPGVVWERRIDPHQKGMLLRGDNYGETRPAGPRSKQSDSQVSQKIEQREGNISAKYRFVNFNNDPLQVTYSLPVSELTAYRQKYGYTDADLEALKQWQVKALDDALQYAIKNRLSQAQLNKNCDAIKQEYLASFYRFLQSRGFERIRDGVYAVDIPEVTKRNVTMMRQISRQLADAGLQRNYGSDELVSAALSLVQTAVQYENVPEIVDGRRTGGVYPPADTLVRGKGDCDTKAALLASILLNWNRIGLIGVTIPNHYLIGILRNPVKGDVFVEFKGLKYVLIEQAGPAWLPPGMVGDYTRSILKAGTGIKIEQITAAT